MARGYPRRGGGDCAALGRVSRQCGDDPGNTATPSGAGKEISRVCGNGALLGHLRIGQRLASRDGRLRRRRSSFAGRRSAHPGKCAGSGAERCCATGTAMKSNRPPIAIIIVACLYILVGVAGFAAHFKELITRQPDAPLMELTELIALVCGIFLLRRQNWARWLAVAWIAFHVVISAFHPLPELA